MSLFVHGVSKRFPGTLALDDVSIEVPEGSRLAVVGASGSGKSTLLRTIAGFVQPDVGRITLGDRELASPAHAVPAHKRDIGYVSQDGALFPHLTVEQNIGFGVRSRHARTARVREVMQLASLDERLAKRYPHELSGGQQQRVALARALATRPRIMLLDEPFSALDTGLREQTRAAVIDVLERSGMTAVLVTHDQEEALSFGQAIGVMADGQLQQSGAPDLVFDNPRSSEIAAFLGAAVFVEAVVRDGLAECAFGSVPVRHDHSRGDDRVRAMFRPQQLDIAAASGGSAVVRSVRPMGATSEVCIVVDDSIDVTLRMPLHRLGSISAGTRVAVSVDGGAVVYPVAH